MKSTHGLKRSIMRLKGLSTHCSSVPRFRCLFRNMEEHMKNESKTVLSAFIATGKRDRSAFTWFSLKHVCEKYHLK